MLWVAEALGQSMEHAAWIGEIMRRQSVHGPSSLSSEASSSKLQKPVVAFLASLSIRSVLSGVPEYDGTFIWYHRLSHISCLSVATLRENTELKMNVILSTPEPWYEMHLPANRNCRGIFPFGHLRVRWVFRLECIIWTISTSKGKATPLASQYFLCARHWIALLSTVVGARSVLSTIQTICNTIAKSNINTGSW